MEGDGLFCPAEECEENRGGYCNIKQDGPLGWAATAYFIPGQTNYMAPLGPVMGVPSVGADGQLSMAPEWWTWRNCPRLRDKNQKK